MEFLCDPLRQHQRPVKTAAKSPKPNQSKQAKLKAESPLKEQEPKLSQSLSEIMSSQRRHDSFINSFRDPKLRTRPNTKLSAILRSMPHLVDEQKINVVSKGVAHIDLLSIKQQQNTVKLFISHNSITAIDKIAQFRNLRVLSLSDNLIDDVHALAHLRPLRLLEVLSMEGNPIAQFPHYRMHVLHNVPSLRVLDNLPVQREERSRAAITASQDLQMQESLFANHCTIHKLQLIQKYMQLHLELRASVVGRFFFCMVDFQPAVDLDKLNGLWDYEACASDQERHSVTLHVNAAALKFYHAMITCGADGVVTEQCDQRRLGNTGAWNHSLSEVLAIQKKAIMRLRAQCEQLTEHSNISNRHAIGGEESIDNGRRGQRSARERNKRVKGGGQWDAMQQMMTERDREVEAYAGRMREKDAAIAEYRDTLHLLLDHSGSVNNGAAFAKHNQAGQRLQHQHQHLRDLQQQHLQDDQSQVAAFSVQGFDVNLSVGNSDHSAQQRDADGRGKYAAGGVREVAAGGGLGIKGGPRRVERVPKVERAQRVPQRHRSHPQQPEQEQEEAFGARGGNVQRRDDFLEQEMIAAQSRSEDRTLPDGEMVAVPPMTERENKTYLDKVKELEHQNAESKRHTKADRKLTDQARLLQRLRADGASDTSSWSNLMGEQIARKFTLRHDDRSVPPMRFGGSSRANRKSGSISQGSSARAKSQSPRQARSAARRATDLKGDVRGDNKQQRQRQHKGQASVTTRPRSQSPVHSRCHPQSDSQTTQVQQQSQAQDAVDGFSDQLDSGIQDDQTGGSKQLMQYTDLMKQCATSFFDVSTVMGESPTTAAGVSPGPNAATTAGRAGANAGAGGFAASSSVPSAQRYARTDSPRSPQYSSPSRLHNNMDSDCSHTASNDFAERWNEGCTTNEGLDTHHQPIAPPTVLPGRQAGGSPAHSRQTPQSESKFLPHNEKQEDGETQYQEPEGMKLHVERLQQDLARAGKVQKALQSRAEDGDR
jgi:hypothetical protein